MYLFIAEILKYIVEKYIFLDADMKIFELFLEMGIGDLIKDQTFRAEDLPTKLCAISRCYRPEISRSASEAHLYRVHEFNKVLF